MNVLVRPVLVLLVPVLLVLVPGAAPAATLTFKATDGRVEAGKTVQATITLGASAPAAVELTVASSSPSFVKVPPRVTVAAGSTRVTFAVETVAGVTSDLAVTITVDSVVPSPRVPPVTARLTLLREPQVASVTFEPARVTAGQTATGTVSLSRPAGFGGVTVPLKTLDPALLRLPATVTIAAGSTSGTFQVTGPSVTQFRSFGVEAPLGGTSRSGALQVEPAPLVVTGITLPPQVLSDEAPVQGRITLNRAVGTQFSEPVTLASDNPSVIVAASIVARAGETSATFNVSGRNVPAGSPPATVKITASMGTSSQSATTTLLGRKVLVSTVSVQNGAVTSGQSANGQVLLNTASLQPVKVILGSSSPNLSVPESVTVPAGQTSATFPVSGAGLATGAPTLMATLTATLEGVARTASVRVSSPNPVVASLTVPAKIQSGDPAQTGQVTLAEPSKTDTSVSLQSTFQGLRVPASISIPAGQTAGSFSLTAAGLPEGGASVTSTISAVTPFPGSPIKTATVIVTTPPPAVTVKSVTFSPPGPLRGPASTSGTVTLSGPAPAAGTTVFMAVVQGFSFTSVSPASVFIPGGSTTGTFQVQVTTNFLSDGTNTPMTAGLGCIGARIGAQASVRGCVSVGK